MHPAQVHSQHNWAQKGTPDGIPWGVPSGPIPRWTSGPIMWISGPILEQWTNTAKAAWGTDWKAVRSWGADASIAQHTPSHDQTLPNAQHSRCIRILPPKHAEYCTCKAFASTGQGMSWARYRQTQTPAQGDKLLQQVKTPNCP